MSTRSSLKEWRKKHGRGNEVRYVKIVYEADEINSDLDLRFAQVLAKESGLGLWDAGHKNGSRYLTFCKLMLSEAEAKS